MEKLKPYLIMTLALLLALLTCCSAGCAERIRLPYDYLSAPFRAELRWCEGDLSLSAEVSAAPANVSGKPWDISLRLTAPESVRDIRIERKDGAISLTYEGLTLTGETYEALLRAVDLLLWDAPLEGLCREELMGVPVLYGRRRSEDTQGTVEVWLDESGAPRQLCHGALILTVLSFESIPT